MHEIVDVDAYRRHFSVPMKISRAAFFWSRVTGSPLPHRATLIRWIQRGVRGVRLKGERYGNLYYVRPCDIAAFHEEMNRGKR